MGKRILAVSAALLVVFVAIIGLIWYATRDGAPPAQDQPPGVVAIDAAPLVSVAPVDLARAPLGGVPVPEYVIVKDEPAPPPAAGSWEAVPILAARRGAIALDLEDVQANLSECFSPSVASRDGGPVLETKDAAPLRDAMTTTLLLELEVRGDRVLIVDAPVESRGQAASGTIACAQAILRGRTAPSPGLAPGKHRLRFSLAP